VVESLIALSTKNIVLNIIAIKLAAMKSNRRNFIKYSRLQKGGNTKGVL
jgi:hypothetical protein